MNDMSQSISRYRDIIYYRTLAGLKSESRQNYLGYIWFFLEPLLVTAILYFAFGHLFTQRGAEYVLIILLGMIMWQWFESSVFTAMLSIRQKVGVLEHYKIPMFIFPFVNIAINTWKFLFVLLTVLLLALFVEVTGEHLNMPSLSWLALPFYLLLQLLLILGVGMLLAVAVSYINDLVTLVSSMLRLLFFVSGVFFRLDRVPEHLQFAFLANPMANFIECYRIVLLDGSLPPSGYTIYLTCLSVGLFMLGFFLCKSQEGKLLKCMIRE